MTAKIALVMQAQETGTPIISSMGAGNKLNPAMFEVADIYKTSVAAGEGSMRANSKARSEETKGGVFQGAAGHADRGYVDQLPCALYLPAGSEA